jgi:hypothetical protein
MSVCTLLAIELYYLVKFDGEKGAIDQIPRKRQILALDEITRNEG